MDIWIIIYWEAIINSAYLNSLVYISFSNFFIVMKYT